MAYGLRGVVASSAQISVEAGRPGWHAARAGLAACLGMHFENGMPGQGCPCPVAGRSLRLSMALRSLRENFAFALRAALVL